MRIAIVIQRYGEEIMGGAETLARKIANILAERHAVTIVTTTAVDYVSWRSQLPEGENHLDGLPVLRFRPDFERQPYWYEIDRLVFSRINIANFSAVSPAARERFIGRLRRLPPGFQEEYIKHQGPYSSSLLYWLREHNAAFDGVLFFSYLYPTTYYGAECIPREKAYLIPTLHDEPMAHLPAYARVFSGVRQVLFSTHTEQALAQRIYGSALSPSEVIGYGIELAEAAPGSVPADNIPFVLYCGRIDLAKGFPLLFDYFLRFKTDHPSLPLKLYLIGKDAFGIPEHPDIVYQGFVSEEEKVHYLRTALFLIHPAPFESLSLVLLEAFLCGTPALVNGRCEVLVDHCRVSGGGLWFTDYEEFARGMRQLIGHREEREQMGQRGKEYAERLYSLEAYKGRLFSLFSTTRR